MSIFTCNKTVLLHGSRFGSFMLLKRHKNWFICAAEFIFIWLISVISGIGAASSLGVRRENHMHFLMQINGAKMHL